MQHPLPTSTNTYRLPSVTGHSWTPFGPTHPRKGETDPKSCPQLDHTWTPRGPIHRGEGETECSSCPQLAPTWTPRGPAHRREGQTDCRCCLHLDPTWTPHGSHVNPTGPTQPKGGRKGPQPSRAHRHPQNTTSGRQTRKLVKRNGNAKKSATALSRRFGKGASP
jgi:hypothetical protein